MNKSLRRTVMLCCLATLTTAGAEWPGRERELAGELTDASAGRRVELLAQLAAAGDAAGEQAVVHALADADVTVRLAAAQLAARYRIGAARTVLAGWLDDPQPDVRAAGARALGALGDTASMPALVRLLGDSDVQVRLAAVEAVHLLGGPEATVPLLDRLADPESAVRVATARALGELGDARAVLSLLGALQDAIPEVREATATALGRLRDARATRGLLGLLRDPVADVRLSAVRALGTLNSAEAVVDLAPLTLRDDPRADPLARAQLARAAVQSIGRIGGPDARDVLVRAFRRADGDRELARAAGNALRAMGTDAQLAVPALAAAPVAPGVFGELVELLGDIGGEQAADALVNFYEAPPPGLMRMTPQLLAAIGRTGTPTGLRALLRAAAAREPSDRRGADALVAARVRGVVQGLDAYAARRGRLDEEALDPILELARLAEGLGEPGRAERARVATLMGRTHNPRAARVLAPMLASSDGALRTAAADALREVGVAGVEARVADALADALPAVRLGAADALGAHGGPAALDALIAVWNGPRPIDRAGAARAVGRIGSRTRDPRAFALLRDAGTAASTELWSALLDAMAFLAASGDAEALGALQRASEQSGLGPLAAEALANALASADGAAAARIAPVLLALAQQVGEPHARAAAVWGLARAPGDVDRVLLSALADGSSPVVANAAGALARRFATGTTPPAGARDALCGALERRRDPAVRANVLLAVARGGLACDAERQRRMLLDGRWSAVRRAAAESLATAARGEDDAARTARGALGQCAAADRDPAVAQHCAALLGPPVAPTEAAAGPDTLDAMVIGADEESIVRDAPVLVVMADGVTRVATTGPSGWVHERAAPRGAYSVFDPATLPLEP